MLVIYDKRLVILATPKTGSTAIAAALESFAQVSIQRPPALKHTSLQRYTRFLAPYLEATSGAAFTVVALMREPRDWLGSWYRYRQREDMPNPKNRVSGASFDDFVKSWCSDDPPPAASVGSQSRFLQPKSGARVDLLFRYEAIEGFVAFLEDRLNCEIVLPRLNVSPQAEMQLSPKTEQLLAEKAAPDFALYADLLAAKDAPYGALAKGV